MGKYTINKKHGGIFKFLKWSFREIEFFKGSNWKNLIRNPIVNNIVIISIIVPVLYLGYTTYNKSERYFSNNELWDTISDKYNTTKEGEIAKQEDSFKITNIYDSLSNTEKSQILNTNYKVASKYLVEKQDKESFELGDIGDFIGGYFGFWIGIIGALLTFLAFYVQYRANRDVQKQFRLQQFENQLHKMMDVYLNNKDKFTNQGYKNPCNEAVDLKEIEGDNLLEKLKKLIELDLPTQKKTKIFSIISFNNNYVFNNGDDDKFFEYITRDHLVFQKFLVELKVINRVFIEAYKLKKKLEEEDLGPEVKRELFKKSYSVFFDGLNKFNKAANARSGYVAIAVKILESIREIHKKNGTKVFENFYEGKNEESKTLWLKLNYEPFKGYLHFLPQYFRGLYSIVNYVVNENEDLNLSEDQKKNYLRTLRSTMSNYEQTLLFYNWYSTYGARWEDGENNFFTDYKMIHNLQRNTLIDNDLKVQEILGLNDEDFKEVFDNF